MSYDNGRQGECTMDYRDGWERFVCSGRVEDYLSYRENVCGQMTESSEADRTGSRAEEGRYAGLYHGDGDGFKNRSCERL